MPAAAKQMVETSDVDMDLPSAENEARKASGGGGGIFGDLVGSLPKFPSLPAFPNFFGGGTDHDSGKQPVKRKPENKGEAVKIALGPSPKIEVNSSLFYPFYPDIGKDFDYTRHSSLSSHTKEWSNN